MNYDDFNSIPRVTVASIDVRTSSVWYYDRPSADLAIVEEVVGLAGALEREVLEQHLDLARLREADDLH